MPTTTHVIRRGETLSSIAKQYACSVDELASANQIKNRNVLAVGQTLAIPNSRTRQTPDATPPKPEEQASPPNTKEKSRLDQIHDALLKTEEIAHGLLNELLQRFRATEANESEQHEENVPVSPADKPVTPPPKEPSKKKNSKGKQSISEVKAKLKESFGREPHVVTFKGVKLTENEKKQIMASVATCEMNADGFGSINADQEFVGRSKNFGTRGIETNFSRIVHIGLSYGIIQFTQDGGELGNVLKIMYKKNPSRFVEIFGNKDEKIAQTLITLTTTGHPDLEGNDSVPLCGQSYWNKIKSKDEGKELKKLANQDEDKNNHSDLPISREIRGKRVQPLSPQDGMKAIDIWQGVWRERFLLAGKETDFQEAQIEYAVSRYFKPVVEPARKNNVRSALALAFIAACSVRGASIQTLFSVAKEIGVGLPFKGGDDERKCVEAIANAKGDKYAKIKGYELSADECRRAKKLISDELGFLSDDLYDIETY